MLQVPVDTVDANIDEQSTGQGLEPLEFVLAVAKAKAGAVDGQGRPVLAADTVVCLDNEVFGKPSDRDDATRMLRQQSGSIVQVMSAVVLVGADGSTDERIAISTLKVSTLDNAAIEEYLATGEGDDKAGALAFQGGAKAFTTLLDGSRSNVVGLPLAETIELLEQAGIPVDAKAVEEPQAGTL